MNKLRIQDVEGHYHHVDVSLEIGEMAVTRLIDGTNWSLTHKPTSFRLPFIFRSSIAAEVTLVELQGLDDWEESMKQGELGELPGIVQSITDICVSNGAQSVDNPTDNEEMGERLKEIIDRSLDKIL